MSPKLEQAGSLSGNIEKKLRVVTAGELCAGAQVRRTG
jgi:hypothetical protein